MQNEEKNDFIPFWKKTKTNKKQHNKKKWYKWLAVGEKKNTACQHLDICHNICKENKKKRIVQKMVSLLGGGWDFNTGYYPLGKP